MSDVVVMPELKQIVGAMLFAAKAPLSLAEMRKILVQTGEVYGGEYKEFAKLKEADIAAAIQQLGMDLIAARAGVHVSEIASGFRLNNDAGCGPWLRILLDKGRAQRLSKPALETLAIIAYRQPVTRGEIEGVRGVAVDAIIRNLMELQLIKIVGRSELPGRPWLFGTTQKFLESFGLKNMDDMPSIQELKRIQSEQEEREIAAAAERAAAEAQQPQMDLSEKPAAQTSDAAGEQTTETKTSEEAAMGVGREDIDRDYDGDREEDFEEEEEEENDDVVDDDEEEEEEADEEEEAEDDVEVLDEKEVNKELTADAVEDEDEEDEEDEEDDDEYDEDDDFDEDDDDDDDDDEDEEEAAPTKGGGKKKK